MSDTHQLKRGLKNRHVQLLAIGGAIGTGLFLGSGRAIHLAGPSIIFAYLITGVICFFIMRALGELLLSNLICLLIFMPSLSATRPSTRQFL